MGIKAKPKESVGGQVFISYVEEDADLVTELVHELEDVGLTTWHYGRDSLPGVSYLAQIARAVEACEAIIVIISPRSISSDQVTSEIVRGFELGKPFVPVLRGISHPAFQQKQPEWRGALRAATSIQIPPEGISAILPRILGGLRALGVMPKSEPEHRPDGGGGGAAAAAENVARVAVPAVGPPGGRSPPAAPSISPGEVRLTACFNEDAFPGGDDPLGYCLVELLIAGAEDGAAAGGVDADLALVLDVSGSMEKPDRYPLLREAVGELLRGLGETDRVSITVFSEGAEIVVALVSGADAADRCAELIEAMDRSKLLFGRKTTLAPALKLGLDSLGPGRGSAGRVRRLYVLTDGELHDSAACETALGEFHSRRAEVHVYGFGDEFNARELKQLVSDQLGGTVKPICNTEGIVATFAHVARVNRRLVGQEAKLVVTFAPNVVPGDAWVFRPASRYLGPLQKRLEYVIGGLEAGRTYSLLLEFRLPPNAPASETAVGTIQASWTSGGQALCYNIAVAAPRRASLSGEPRSDAASRVNRAYDALNVLRNETDVNLEIASLKARRELAVIERRDPNLVAALDKMIATLTSSPDKKPDVVKSWLTAKEQQFLNSDTDSVSGFLPDFGTRIANENEGGVDPRAGPQ